MWLGQRRLLSLSIKIPTSYLDEHLPNKSKIAMYYQPLGSIKELLDDLRLAAIDKLMHEGNAPVWDEDSFNRLRDLVRGKLNDTALELGALAGEILTCAHELKRKLKGNIPLSVAMAYADVEQSLDNLIRKGFMSQTPHENLMDFPRYIKAFMERLDKVIRDPVRDQMLSRQLGEVKELYKNTLSRYAHKEIPKSLEKVRFMIEELRVSYFAQHLGVKGPISDKRIENELKRILTEYPPQS